ncbi:adenylate/guanylate cyclase domain-containing protein [Actinomycetospora straminea]|uniref:Adenylate/guanylate cyclase domain-containing protein n=1 Tax=Actinomycetospora straminea TaxID=663607 RepID=A0ABP9E8S3_9PSEU|nr:adenylate/guanylate cyclase domain-containing protein [Actinomycetospora straminea]MDD7931904.1 adenylate/guanylate cyclase domain-containing protein [Actinomycetospora straminea]
MSQRGRAAEDADTPDRSQDRSQDRGLRLVTRVALALVVVTPNIVGAGVVLVVAAWVLPLGELVEDDPGALMRNLVAFGAYLLAAVVVGSVWGHFRMRVPRAPGPGADQAAVRRHRKRVRRVVLRGPLRLATVQTVLWLAALVLFVLINVFSSPRLGVSVGITVGLGGVATVAVTYRLVERVLRREVARVLNDKPPEGRVLPGVALRSVGSWAVGTAVPLVGVLLAAVASLAFGGYTTDRLALVVLVLGGVALVVGFLVTVLTAASTAAPVLAVRRAQRRVEDGDYDAEVPVFDTTELGLLQAGFNTMVAGLRERERVRDLFGRHVGEDVARTALENDVELGGEVREVAVLFVDLVGSTRLAASRPPQEVVEMLNGFFAVVIDVVEQHDGWINKFEGDAALAVFGAPTALDDAAGCALRAGRELSRRIATELDGISAGIGVSAGEAVAGNIGDTRRYEYTVIGDPVNEAARLTEAAKEIDGCVLASGAALSRAGDEADRWQVIDARVLRGREGETDLAVPREHAGACAGSGAGPGSDEGAEARHGDARQDAERRAPSLG